MLNCCLIIIIITLKISLMKFCRINNDANYGQIRCILKFDNKIHARTQRLKVNIQYLPKRSIEDRNLIYQIYEKNKRTSVYKRLYLNKFFFWSAFLSSLIIATFLYTEANFHDFIYIIKIINVLHQNFSFSRKKR